LRRASPAGPAAGGAATAAPASPPPPASGTASTPKPRDDATWRFRPSFGTGISVTSVVAPNPSVAPALELGLEAERGNRHGPLLLLSLERFGSKSFATDAGLADFSTLLGRLTLCPLHWPSEGRLYVAACGAFEAGSLQVH